MGHSITRTKAFSTRIRPIGVSVDGRGILFCVSHLQIEIQLLKHSFPLLYVNFRISVIFRVRSAKAVKITDASLLKRLGILCGGE